MCPTQEILKSIGIIKQPRLQLIRRNLWQTQAIRRGAFPTLQGTPEEARKVQFRSQLISQEIDQNSYPIPKASDWEVEIRGWIGWWWEKDIRRYVLWDCQLLQHIWEECRDCHIDAQSMSQNQLRALKSSRVTLHFVPQPRWYAKVWINL